MKYKGDDTLKSYFVYQIKGLDHLRFYFKGSKCYFKNILKKTLIKLHIEYCTQAFDLMSTYGNYCVILRLEGISKMTKIMKKVNDYSSRVKITLLERRMRESNWNFQNN